MTAADRHATGSEAMRIDQSRVAANGIDVHVATAGPVDGPMVVLLHGFPEFSYGWRDQIHALASAGFRVVVPDQRGYGLTTKPKAVSAYRLEVLVQDVLALVDALGGRSFTVVGHDWGGIVAWRLASDHPDRLDRLVIINAPNLDVAFRHATRSPTQLLKSFYVALFQIPYVPEWALSVMDFDLLAAALRSSSRPGTFSDAELRVYKEAWGQPRALTAMLAWYRALPSLAPRPPKRIVKPTLVLWGDRDSALDSTLAEDSAALCDDVVVHHLVDATHWVHHEQAATVNRMIVDFLAMGDATVR